MKNYSICSKSARQMKFKTTRGHQMKNNTFFSDIINFALHQE